MFIFLTKKIKSGKLNHMSSFLRVLESTLHFSMAILITLTVGQIVNIITYYSYYCFDSPASSKDDSASLVGRLGNFYFLFFK